MQISLWTAVKSSDRLIFCYRLLCHVLDAWHEKACNAGGTLGRALLSRGSTVDINGEKKIMLCCWLCATLGNTPGFQSIHCKRGAWRKGLLSDFDLSLETVVWKPVGNKHTPYWTPGHAMTLGSVPCGFTTCNDCKYRNVLGEEKKFEKWLYLSSLNPSLYVLSSITVFCFFFFSFFLLCKLALNSHIPTQIFQCHWLNVAKSCRPTAKEDVPYLDPLGARWALGH